MKSIREKAKNECFKNPLFFIAFGFGSGLSSKMPGTCGTLAAIPLYMLLAHLPSWLYLLSVIGAFLLGVIICNNVSKQLGVEDYSGIVWDEIVGYWAVMFLAPFKVQWIILGFILFRLFDIWKPFPIRWVEQRVKGGIGIMIDDILAAVPAFVILQLCIRCYFC